MEKKFLVQYFNKQVAIGVPHTSRPRPFFYYGKLIELTDQYLILQLVSGIKHIEITDIIDVHFDTFSPRGCP